MRIGNMQETINLETINFLNPEWLASGRADEIFIKLRKEAPVFWNKTEQEGGFWVLTKYDDIATVLKDSHTFSSEYGNMLRVYGGRDPAAGTMMSVTDQPRHSFLRKLHSDSFNPKAVSQMKSNIHSFVCELLDQMVEGETFDFVDEIAGKVPVSVTCSLLGIPREDWSQIADLGRASLTAEDPEFRQGQDIEESLEFVNNELFTYLLDMIQYRRREPGHDLISKFIESGMLDEKEILLNSFSLLLAGTETTKYAAAGGMLALIKHAEEAERLYQEPSLMPLAIEEILRWTTPIAHVLRVATQDVQIKDTRIRAGETVTMWTASANRDEDVFEDPFRFNLSRDPNPHLAFGKGRHYCIGGNFARMELNLLFSEIVARGYRFETKGPAVRVRSNLLNGFKHIPVCMTSS